MTRKLPLVQDSSLSPLFEGLRPYLPVLVVLALLLALLASPLPGRGPRLLQRRDPWRRFKFAARRAVMARVRRRWHATFGGSRGSEWGGRAAPPGGCVGGGGV